MNCAACGAELESGASFCPKCGTKAGASLTQSPNEFAAAQMNQKLSGNDEQEVKLWSGGYSGKAMIGSWLAGIVLTIALIIGCVLLPDGVPAFIGIIVVIWLALALVLAYRKLAIHYDMTTQRFIHQSGILTRTSDRIEMIDIDDVTFQQSLIQRMVNVGTIKLSSSDRTHPMLHLFGIDEVKRVADLIDEARRKERRKRGLHIENI